MYPIITLDLPFPLAYNLIRTNIHHTDFTIHGDATGLQAAFYDALFPLPYI